MNFISSSATSSVFLMSCVSEGASAIVSFDPPP
jgi:hypothetical protein